MENEGADVENVNMKLLIRKRGNIKQKLTGFINFFAPIKQAIGQNLKVGEKIVNELKIRIEKLIKVFDEYEEVQSLIELNCELEKLDDHYAEREDFTSQHTDTLATASLMLEKITEKDKVPIVTPVVPPTNTSIMSNIVNMNLPPIKLPVFNGEHSKWLEYRETFESLIHDNCSLREIQKFHYLRASLGEGAIKVIQSLEFSSQNYTEAWDLICQRFDNSRLLVNNHLHAIFNLESLSKESVIGLRNLIDSLNKHLRALKSLGLPTEHWDAWLIYLISIKLDKGTARSWEQENDKNLPTFNEFLTFLCNRADFLESLEVKHSTSTKLENKGSKPSYSFFSKENEKFKCFLCDQNHAIYNCNVFIGFSVHERWDKVKELKLCSNCLCKGHFSKTCRFYPCKKCRFKHHTLLHSQPKPSSEKSEIRGGLPNKTREGSEQTLVVTQGVDNSEIAVALSSQSSKREYVLLSTAEILVKNSHGRFCTARAVLDSGSQSCFISERFCKELALPVYNSNVSVMGINNEILSLQKRCDLTVKSQCNEFYLNMSCLVLPKITENLPMFDIDISHWDIPANIVLADSNYFVSNQIDVLIGAKHFWNILKDGKISLGKNLPILQNTEFGYVISGTVSSVSLNSQKTGLVSHNKFKVPDQTVINSLFVTTEQIHEDMMKFWAIEEASKGINLLEDDEICENHFINEHYRNFEGRFVVRIPLKNAPTEVGETKALAIKRFLNLERKFAFNEDFKVKYIHFMKEYKMLGHMELLKNNEDPALKVSCFLPHHGVIREESLSTKLRVVFDGSVLPSHGKSLNQIQYKGPPIQNNIFPILLRFRVHKVVVTADITKMYRQILVDPRDRCLQKIVWRDDPNKSLSTFVLNTVTYGMASSPFLAIRCIKQLAFENQDKFPNASKVILNDFYVDDLISGFDSVAEAIETCSEISTILLSGCFPLRKWSSNSAELLATLRNSSDPLSVLNFGHDDQHVKTLGIQWASSSDVLTFHIDNVDISLPATKRNVLSSIAKIFDPLGFLSPCIIVVKILIQALWVLKLDWDDNIPEDLKFSWDQFRKNLDIFNSLKIPRYIFRSSENSIIEIHGFSDSSQKAYSAVIYIRSFDNEGTPTTHLLCSKTKVAPLKSMTVPRLELCGALMLARLFKIICKVLQLNFNSFLWCDSQIVLHWLHTPLDRLQVFVRNRVSEIRNLTDLETWRYVNTKENPADIATRGMTPKDLVESKFWWQGPDFLRNEKSWPDKMTFSSKLDLPELIRNVCVLKVNEIGPYLLFNRFSSLNKLLRVQSYCCRFIFNSKISITEKEKRLTGPLSPKELEHVMIILIKLAQTESFSSELTILTKGGTLKPKHRLLALSPFIDCEGLLRVGGRLKYAPISYNKKHPLLLDGRHRLSKLILENEHVRLHHAGPQLLLYSVRERYWPTNGMNVAKYVVRKCVTCFRSEPRNCNAIMSDLPSSRVTVSAPFTITGVDYAGPFILKDRKGRGAKQFKAYICLFICFCTKAVHLELVTDLTTEAFIATFRRFASRRGKPSHLYSDNGSNFVGANKELSNLFEFLSNSNEKIFAVLSDYRTEWHFIPPRSPTFGGLWESNIKGVKYHLKRVIQNTILTYEEFSTVLVQIEAILNSRPLYPLSSDPSEFESLSPSHFLIGRPIMTVPDPSFEEVKLSSLSRFQLLQKINQDFWKRWSKCYLNQLQQRGKWRQTSTSIKLDALVLLKDDNLPPCKWLLGRVTAIHPGSDNVVRVVTVRTSKGDVKRAITKVCPLPDPEDTQILFEPNSSTRGSMEKM